MSKAKTVQICAYTGHGSNGSIVDIVVALRDDGSIWEWTGAWHQLPSIPDDDYEIQYAPVKGSEGITEETVFEPGRTDVLGSR